MTYLALIVIPHIHQQGFRIFNKGVELFGINVDALVGNVEGGIIQSVGHYLFPHLYLELQKRFVILFDGYIQPYIFKKTYAVEVGLECFKIVGRHGELGIDPFVGHINPSKYIQFIPMDKQVVP